MSELETRLAEIGHQLPIPAAPAAAYVPIRQVGTFLYVSGQISAGPDGVIAGILGQNMSTEQGQNAARACALAILAQIRHTANRPLEDIEAIVKLTCLVASTPSFNEQHLVANGASELLVALLGDKGKHARAAFGVASLPLGAAVEIEAIVEMRA